MPSDVIIFEFSGFGADAIAFKQLASIEEQLQADILRSVDLYTGHLSRSPRISRVCLSYDHLTVCTHTNCIWKSLQRYRQLPSNYLPFAKMTSDDRYGDNLSVGVVDAL
jgi:hypothetical protein